MHSLGLHAEHLLRVTLESNVKLTVQIIDNFGKQPISIGSALDMIMAKDKPDWSTLVVPAGEHEGIPLINMIGKAMTAWREGQPARTNKKNDTQTSIDSRGRGDRDGRMLPGPNPPVFWPITRPASPYKSAIQR